MPKKMLYLTEMDPGFFRNEMVYREDASSDDGDTPVTAGFLLKNDEKDVVEELYSRLVVVYVLRGRGRYIDHAGMTHELRPGSVFVRHPYLKHSTYIEADSEYAETFVSLSRKVVHFLESLGKVGPDKLVFAGELDKRWPVAVDRMVKRLKMAEFEELNQLQLEMFHWMVDLINFSQPVLSGEQGMGDIVLLARHKIEAALYDRRPVPELLREIGLSYSRLRSLFKEQTGVSPGEYRIQKRLDFAKSLLGERRFTVQQIAHTLGYPDAYTFSAQFKKFVGVSPRNYVKKVRERGRSSSKHAKG